MENIEMNQDKLLSPPTVSCQFLSIEDDFEKQQEDLYLKLSAQIPLLRKKSTSFYNYEAHSVPMIMHDELDSLRQEEYSVQSASSTPYFSEQNTVRKCSCTRSKCQQNYCQCFKFGLKCSQLCTCVSCGNHSTLFLSSPLNINRHCNCKKNNCLKKYCQCHKMGRQCTSLCNCSNCNNKYEVKPHPIEEQNDQQAIKRSNSQNYAINQFMDNIFISDRGSLQKKYNIMEI